ncbi:MAG: 2-amino-4-hydroxy-6-hydroxymethyldihydropteridine diphosphokinase [Rhodobacteraceae bacterium]|nr:2-amino-4-hydroxy-6-hydroxymethyldihydropteridine diphosphokinase [Paracoccaceae bacterium]
MISVEKDNSAILIALGGNLPGPSGDPAGTLRAALQMLAARGMALAAVSRFFVTPAHPPGSGPDYVNACARLVSVLPPPALLAELHAVEAVFGRARGTRWAARGLDLDLLAAGQAVLPDEATSAHWRALPANEQLQRTPDCLILPHPRLHERAFVLIPLADIAPRWRHPGTHKTVAEMLAALPEAEKAAIHTI